VNKSRIVQRAKVLKRRFDVKLRPVKVMLLSKRNSLPATEWHALVESTMADIQKNPQKYLGEDLPPPDLTSETIRYVFEGFLHDIKIRDVQSFRKDL
jgi:hypothetical protein